MARRFQIFGMSGRDFERAICALFRGRGYTVTGFAGGGMDLGLRKDGARYVARLGFWQKPEVGCTVAHALGQEIAAHGAQGGFVVTGGRFTPEAREFARAARIELLDGDTLAALMDPAGIQKSPLAT
jgi:restriction system protein